MNSIMRGQPQQNQNNQFNNMINSFSKNPVQFLLQRGLNIPSGLNNNPQGIVQHLLNTGQMSQAQFNQLQNVVQNFKG